MGIDISCEQWLERCASRFMAIAGLTPELSMEMAKSQLENINGDLKEDPEQAADDEMSYWTPD